MSFTNRKATITAQPVRRPGMAAGDSYSIGQVVRAFGVTPRAVRYYEACGLVQPARNGNQRVFSARDFERVRFIVEARRANLSVVDVMELLALQNGGDGGRRQIERKLELLGEQLAQANTLCASLQAEIDRGAAALGALDRGHSKAA